MTSIPVWYALIVAAVLFVLGLIGVLVRRNTLFILLGIEIVLNAAGLASCNRDLGCSSITLPRPSARLG